MPGWTEELALAEQALTRRADLIVASSPGVRRNLPGTGPSRAHVLQNGADTALFAAGLMGDAPADLASIPRPRIGYCGAINPKLDLALVDRLAGLRQEWHWVFVGKCIEHQIMTDAASRPAWERLCSRSNVHFLGPRPYHAIPRYQAHMDVNTLCYRTDGDGWWTSLSPLKLHEYLAVGRPVVAASLEVLERLRHVVAVAEREDEWLAALGHAIHEGGVGTPEERRQVAFGNDWKAIVDQLDSWLLASLGQSFSATTAVCPDIPVPQPATP